MEKTLKEMIQRGEEVLEEVLNKLPKEEAECLSEYIEDLCLFSINNAYKIWKKNEEEKIKFSSSSG